MTGFGSARGDAEGIAYDVEIRAVNHRYFKSVIKLPEVWSSAESDIEKGVRRQIARGAVSVTVRMRLTDERAACGVNAAALRRYLDQLREVEVEANPTLRIDLGSLLQLPGVCEPPSIEEGCEKTRQLLMDLIDEALTSLVAMREREGEALIADLLSHCDSIEAGLAVVEARAPGVVTDYQKRLRQRVADLTNAAEVDIDADALTREVAVFAERSDVAEEIARLSGHVEQFRTTVASSQAAGRKLDFIAQEMLREANTIGSKANDAEITRVVVEMKTAVDRIKEQVQNVE